MSSLNEIYYNTVKYITFLEFYHIKVKKGKKYVNNS